MNRDDIAWEKVIDKLNIDLSKDVSKEIPSSMFREIANREARIAAKTDSRKELPSILRENDFFVLPVKNGLYRLVKGDGFHDLEPISDEISFFDSQLDFQMVTGGSMGESKYMQYAYNSGLISNFTGVDDLFLTDTGRFRATNFDFFVDGIGPISQEGTQVQVDGLFEGKDKIVIIETKARILANFNIRQIYYPYRHYLKTTNKKIINLFMIIDPNTEIYHLWEYVFEDEKDYSSIFLKKSKRYRIVEKPLIQEDLSVEESKEMGWGIPQANMVDRIQKIPVLVSKGFDDSKALHEYFEIQERQSSYYREATEMIGLITHKRVGNKYVYELTELGKEYINLRPDKRNEMLAKQMLKLPIMNHVFNLLVKRTAVSLGKEGIVTSEEISKIIEEHSNLSKGTPDRRASTVMAWFKWISENVGVVEKRNNQLIMIVKRQKTLFE